MKCNCGSELIWGGDHTYEDYCLEGNGIVTNFSCPSNECDVDTVIVYTLLEDA
tara:strand:- start:356 stop:514 length:159 start_codon:yes stop_codon:yes gene_type:complete